MTIILIHAIILALFFNHKSMEENACQACAGTEGAEHTCNAAPAEEAAAPEAPAAEAEAPAEATPEA